MTRLYELIAREPFAKNAPAEWVDATEADRDELLRIIRPAMKKATQFYIDNVNDYMFETGWGEERTVKTLPSGHISLKKEFPNVAPPFDVIWMEYSMRKWSESFLHHGALVMAFDLTDSRTQLEIETNTDLYGGVEFLKKQNFLEDARWVLIAYPFFSLADRSVHGPLGAEILSVDPTGAILTGVVPDAQYADESINFWAKQIISPVFLSICFLHCKNVTKERKTRSYRKPRIKGLRGPRYGSLEYWVLHIDPMREILEREGGASEYGIQTALHICRGHFRDYRDGPGLFGKHKVMIWVPDHVKGSAHRGVTLKDYRVSPKKKK